MSDELNEKRMNRDEILANLKSFAEATGLDKSSGDYAVAGGAVMVLWGLKETCKDIDVIVSPTALPRVMAAYPDASVNKSAHDNEKPRLGKTMTTLIEPLSLELLMNTPVPALCDIYIVGGYPCISVTKLIEYKMGMGTKKDLEDIDLLNGLNRDCAYHAVLQSKTNKVVKRIRFSQKHQDTTVRQSSLTLQPSWQAAVWAELIKERSSSIRLEMQVTMGTTPKLVIREKVSNSLSELMKDGGANFTISRVKESAAEQVADTDTMKAPVVHASNEYFTANELMAMVDSLVPLNKPEEKEVTKVKEEETSISDQIDADLE